VPSPTGAEAAAFRRAVGRFATGICVLTTVESDLDHAMTANAVTSVSLDPMLVLACVETEARFHDAVMASGTWAVTILDETARGVSEWLASRGRPLEGQLSRIPFHRGPLTGAALIDAGLAWMECRTTAVHPGGDHSIVVAEVIGIELGSPDAEPLLYFRSAYHKLA
jgi:flavin reductase (DIM6/NTAB) family NADH-FMN oxidoreductase RutF